MNPHINEDLLIKVVLGTAIATEGRRVQRHLAECTRCSEIAGEIRETMRMITEVNVLGGEERNFPRVRWSGAGFWPRVAAALVAGFLLGLLASESLRPSNTEVVRQRILPQSPAISSSFISCDQVDLAVSVR